MATDYGSDLSCIWDVTADMAETSGRTLLAQSIARRLITPRGGLIDDPDYGCGVCAWINDDLSQREIARVSSAIDEECQKDERVLSSETEATFLSGILTVSISLTDGAGPFAMVLAISDVSATILRVSP